MSGGSGLSSRAIIGSFYHQLESNPGNLWVDSVSRLFQSNQESETYKFTDAVPVLREWIGGREAKGLTENGITIANKKWESTLEIPAEWVKRDKTDQIQVRIKELARRANSHYAVLLSALIANGETGLCYDGRPFFDTLHSYAPNNPVNVPGTQSNSKSWDVLSPTQPSNNEFQDVVWCGIETLLGMKDGQAEPANENANKFLVMVPHRFLNVAGTALGAQLIDGTTSSVAVCSDLFGFEVGLAINPRLPWTTKFSVFRADGDVTPFIRQEEQGISVAALAEGSELEFNNEVHHYGIKALDNVGYGLPTQGCLISLI